MNNEAQFGVRFAVKNAKQVQKTMDAINAKLKQMGVSTEQVGKKIDQTGKEAETAGKKQEQALDKGTDKANKMAGALDRVVKKWLSIGGAVTLVAMIVRRAFARADELTGLSRMAQSAGVAENKIYSLGRALKKYGTDSSSAASAYTSLGDILGAARAGRGINQDVVSASARYGIPLNGGMLTEDQLMTNIAIAMKAQRNKGNMFGVRDIANAFGIDEAMMLHLSEKGKDWDRGLPGANLKKAQEEAQKQQLLRDRLNELINQFIDITLPLINDGMQAILDLVNWLKQKFNFQPNKGIATLAEGNVATKNFTPTYEKVFEANKSLGMSDEEADQQAKLAVVNSGQGYTLKGRLEAEQLESAKKWANYYNTTKGIDMVGALNNVKNMLGDVSGANANLVYDRGQLKIVIEDKAGVLRNMYVTGKVEGSNTINVATSVK